MRLLHNGFVSKRREALKRERHHMIYGPSYQAQTRECESCGHSTSVHYDCNHCQKAICENCGLHGDCLKDFCSEACKQEACEHVHVRYECIDDVCEGYVNYHERWTCSDCGADLEEENETITITKRKAA